MIGIAKQGLQALQAAGEIHERGRQFSQTHRLAVLEQQREEEAIPRESQLRHLQQAQGMARRGGVHNHQVVGGLGVEQRGDGDQLVETRGREVEEILDAGALRRESPDRAVDLAAMPLPPPREFAPGVKLTEDKIRCE